MHEFLFTQYPGELAALSAAFLWAIASMVYTRLGQRIQPLILNLTKGLMAIGLIAVTLLVRAEGWPNINPVNLWLLLISGIVGIGLGDTAYFKALNHIGPRRTLLLEALAPPLTTLIALVFLQETLGLQNWLGILLTVLGVAWVISERVPQLAQQRIQPQTGISFALLATFCQASGAVLSRAALAETDVDPLWSTLIRLIGGVLVIVLLLSWQESEPGWKPLRSRQLVGVIALTAFFSTYLGIWLQQISLKYTAAGIAQALSATSPLFILPIAISFGERVSLRATLGVLVTLGGIALLFSRF